LRVNQCKWCCYQQQQNFFGTMDSTATNAVLSNIS